MRPHSPRRHPNVFVQDLGRDRLLSLIDADQLHVLNPTAYQIWLYCDGHHTPDAIAALLAERFPAAPPAHIAADVHNTLAALAAKGLLQTIDPNTKENPS